MIDLLKTTPRKFESPSTSMSMRDITPCSTLRPFIASYKILKTDTELINRVLPNTSVALAFRFNGSNKYISLDQDIKLPTITISGLRKSARLIEYSKNTSTLVVLFKEGGASAFFREPLHYLFGESLALDEIIDPFKVKQIEEQLSNANGDNERICIIEQFLLHQMHKVNIDGLISEAVQQIHQAKGFIRINELIERLCISKDAFEKRFRKAVGSTPKQFASIVRMSFIIKQTSNRDRLLDAALNAGFFDESHFIKTFKQFTGQNPTDFSKSGSYW